jgi:hypothetical protein
MLVTLGMSEPKRVFISYAHESDEHRDRVLALAQRLRREGVDAWLDRFAPHQSDWALWMCRELEKADVVLCICTRTWRHRYDAEEDEGSDTGVRYEGRLLRSFILDSRGNEHKVAAVVFSEEDRRVHVPRDLSSGTIYLLNADYERLYGWLTGRSLVEPVPLGEVRPLESMGEATVRSEGVGGRAHLSLRRSPGLHAHHSLWNECQFHTVMWLGGSTLALMFLGLGLLMAQNRPPNFPGSVFFLLLACVIIIVYALADSHYKRMVVLRDTLLKYDA